jgi:hypothetical protein
MLTSAQFDELIVPIMDLFAEYETSVLVDIARRLAKLAIPSAAWQVQRITESGSLYKDVLKKLSQLTGQSEKEIADLLREAGVQTIKFDDKVYKVAGLKPLPLNLSPAMAQTLKAGIDKLNAVVLNLTRTTAITAQQAFIRASNLAYQQVITGAMSYDQAIRAAIKNVAAEGLHVIDYASGHTDHLDVAIRRNVLTGVAQTAGQLQVTRAEEMGSDLVAVSAHVGARNKGTGPMNHESWQGQIYSRGGAHPKYPNFVERTGYGTGEGLAGWNCRHSFYPFFEGLSSPPEPVKEKRVTLDGKEMSLYEASQVQREAERKVRHWKRQAQALEAARLDNLKETMRVRQWQARLRSIVQQTGLVRQYAREQVQ